MPKIRKRRLSRLCPRKHEKLWWQEACSFPLPMTMGRPSIEYATSSIDFLVALTTGVGTDVTRGVGDHTPASHWAHLPDPAVGLHSASRGWSEPKPLPEHSSRLEPRHPRAQERSSE